MKVARTRQRATAAIPAATPTTWTSAMTAADGGPERHGTTGTGVVEGRRHLGQLPERAERRGAPR